MTTSETRTFRPFAESANGKQVTKPSGYGILLHLG